MRLMIQDLIEDRTRFRTITVGIAVVMYLLLTYDLLESMEQTTKTAINSIAFSSTVPAAVYLGAGLAHAPAVKALDEDGLTLSGRWIETTIDAMFVTDTSRTLDCSTHTLQLLANTLQGLSIAEACTQVLVHRRNVTDRAGDAQLTELRLLAGPPGLYLLKFGVEDADINSVAKPLQAPLRVLSEVLHIEPLSPPPRGVEFGTAFEPFSVQVLSDEWTGLMDKRVVVFSWSTPELEMTEATVHHIFGQGFAQLAGASAFTDVDGIATFGDLRVLAATQTWTYLFFYCEGVVVSWSGEIIDGNRPVAGMKAFAPPVYVSPILLSFLSDEVQIFAQVDGGIRLSDAMLAAESRRIGQLCTDPRCPLGEDPIVVTEGSAFEVTVAVKDFYGQPHQGVRVVATMAEAAGYFLPQQYEPADRGDDAQSHKQLVNPISEPSGVDGVARFTNMQFSARGQHGMYRLQFWANGFGGDMYGTVLSNVYDVRTSVGYVEIVTYGSVLLSMHGGQGAKSVSGVSSRVARLPETIVVKVTDIEREPIQGKRVDDVMLVSDGVLLAGAELIVADEEDQGLQIETGSDGLAVIPVRYLVLPLNVADPDCNEPSVCKDARLVVSVDGVQSSLEWGPLAVAPRNEAHIRKARAEDPVRPLTSYDCQRIEVQGIPGMKLQGDLANVVDDQSDRQSRCVPTDQVTVVAKSALGNDLEVCDGSEEQEGCATEGGASCMLTPATATRAGSCTNVYAGVGSCRYVPLPNCLWVDIRPVQSYRHGTAVPDLNHVVPLQDTDGELCFEGYSGTVRFILDAYQFGATPHGQPMYPGAPEVFGDDPACSSSVIHVNWRSAVAFIVFDLSDPRIGDWHADTRTNIDTFPGPLPITMTFHLQTMEDILAGSELLWAPLKGLADVVTDGRCDLATCSVETLTSPLECDEAGETWSLADESTCSAAGGQWGIFPPHVDRHTDKAGRIWFALTFFGDEYEQVFPFDISDATVEVVSLPPYMPLEAQDSNHELVALELAGTIGSDNRIRAQVFDWGVVQFRSIDFASPGGPNFMETHHYVGVMVRRGVFGEIALVIRTEGSTSPVIRVSVHNPVAHIDIVTEAAGPEGTCSFHGAVSTSECNAADGTWTSAIETSGRKGLPLTIMPVVRVVDHEGQPIDGVQVMASLVAAENSGKEDDRRSLDAAFEFNPEPGTEADSMTRPMSGGQFDFSLLQTEMLMTASNSCVEQYDIQTGTQSHLGEDCSTDSTICGAREICDNMGICVSIFSQMTGAKTSCLSGMDGLASFVGLTPFVSEGQGRCYRPRYYFVPYRSFEFEQHWSFGANIGSNAFSSAYGSKICIDNQDLVTMISEPSATLAEGESFQEAPVVRLSRPYVTPFMTMGPPEISNMGFTFAVTYPALIENNLKTFEVPPEALLKFTRKKIGDSVCGIYIYGSTVNPFLGPACTYVTSKMVESRGRTIFSDELRLTPKLREAAPGERINFKMCSGESLFRGSTRGESDRILGSCSENTRTITVLNKPTSIVLLNDPPNHVWVQGVFEMRVSVTADGYPMPFTEVTAELVPPAGPSLTAKEFLMSAFISGFEDNERCVSAEDLVRVVQAVVDIDYPGLVVSGNSAEGQNLDTFETWLQKFGLKDHSASLRLAIGVTNPDDLFTSLRSMSPHALNRLVKSLDLASESEEQQLRGAISELQLAATGCSIMDCGACSDATACRSVQNGACEFDQTTDSCTFSFVHGDVVTKLQDSMQKRVDALGSTIGDNTGSNCLSRDTAASQMVNGTKPRLDPHSSRAMTDAHGIASFTLQIAEGLSGTYAVEFSASKTTGTRSKPFVIVNAVQHVEITSWDGYPSSNCNGWRTGRFQEAVPNCGDSDSFPLDIPLPEIRVRVTDVMDQPVQGLPASAVKLGVVDNNANRQMTFDELIESIKHLRGDKNDQSPTEAIAQTVSLIIEGAKLLQPIGKASASANAYLQQLNAPVGEQRWRGRFDANSHEFVFDDMQMVAMAEGSYSIQAFVLGISSTPSAASVVVEELSTSSWEYQVMMWVQKLIMFFIFVGAFLGNSAFDSEGRVDLTVVISITVCVAMMVWINYHYWSGGAWKDKDVLFWLLFSDLVFLIVALTATLFLSATSESFRSFEHANSRRSCFYKYTRDMFRQKGMSIERATMGAKVQKVMMENALKIAREHIAASDEDIVLANQTIEALDAKHDGHDLDEGEHSAYLNAVSNKQDAAHTRGICVEIVSRIETYNASNNLDARLSSRARMALPRVLARSQANLDEAQHALQHSDVTEGGARILERYFEETAALTQLHGLPSFLFDLARQAKAIAIFLAAKKRAVRQMASYTYQLKQALTNGDVDAFFFPARAFMSTTVSTIVYCLLAVKFHTFFSSTSESIKSVRDKATNTVSSFLTKMEGLYAEKYDDELSDEAVEYAYAQREAILDLFDELVAAIWTAFVVAFVLTTLIFVYTQLMIFMEIRYQVLAARMGMKTVATDADEKINPFDAMNFVGVSVANTTLALHLLIFVLWAICFPFCYPTISRVIVQYFRDNWSSLLIVLFPALITALVKKKTLAYTYGPPSRTGLKADPAARNRRCYGCYDVWMLFLSMSKGVTAAIVRIVMFVVVGLVSLLSVTQSPLPAWFERYTELDTGSKAYRAMILQSIYQNNPVMNVVAWELLKVPKQNAAASAPRRLRIPVALAAAASVNNNNTGVNTQELAEQMVNTERTRDTATAAPSTGVGKVQDGWVEWGTVKAESELQRWRKNRNRWWLMLLLQQSPMLRTYRATQNTASDEFRDVGNDSADTASATDPADSEPDGLDLGLTAHKSSHSNTRFSTGTGSVVQICSTDKVLAEENNFGLQPTRLDTGTASKYRAKAFQEQESQHAQAQREMLPGQVASEKHSSA